MGLHDRTLAMVETEMIDPSQQQYMREMDTDDLQSARNLILTMIDWRFTSSSGDDAPDMLNQAVEVFEESLEKGGYLDPQTLRWSQEVFEHQSLNWLETAINVAVCKNCLKTPLKLFDDMITEKTDVVAQVS